MIQADLAKINIETGFFTAGESEVAVMDGITRDVLNQLLPGARHSPTLSARLKLGR